MLDDPRSSPLFLRPKQPDKSDANALSRRFRDIVAQKGHFRNVTHASLIADDEDEEEQDGQGDSDDLEEGAKDERLVRGTLKHVNESKQKMVQMVSAAHEQAMFLVDFVSLLESKYSSAGALSMSQGIKQVVPPKTLAYDEWPVKGLEQAEEATNHLVAQGQRLKGLQSAADTLLKAATRLQDDVKKETTYWDELLSVNSAGWAVCRVAKGQHQLGVQLGFPQAGPLFRYRGFVPLMASDDGLLNLGHHAVQSSKKLRLRIVDGDRSIGSNLGAWPISDGSGIEHRIRSARDSLFEEEIFHEIANEARLLTGYGVKWKGSTVHVPMQLIDETIAAQSELQLDLVPQTRRELSSSEPQSDEHASRLALIFKLLMLHTYEQRLENASKPPAPLSEHKTPSQVADLLRPLIMHGFHNAAVLHLRRYIEFTSLIFKRASLSGKEAQIVTTPRLTEDTPRQLIQKLVRSCTTDVTIPFPSGIDEIHIAIRTESSPSEPLLGSSLILTANVRCSVNEARSSADTVTSESKDVHHSRTVKQVFDRHEDLASYLNQLLAQDIAHNVIAQTRPGASARDGEPEVDIITDGFAGKATRGGVRVRVICGAAGLTLTWRKTHMKGAAGEYRWTADSPESLSLEEAMQRILGSG